MEWTGCQWKWLSNTNRLTALLFYIDTYEADYWISDAPWLAELVVLFSFIGEFVEEVIYMLVVR